MVAGHRLPGVLGLVRQQLSSWPVVSAGTRLSVRRGLRIMLLAECGDCQEKHSIALMLRCAHQQYLLDELLHSEQI